MKAILKKAIYAPDMAFTLVSISWLDDAGSSVTFSKGMCIINNPLGHANIAVGKMSISEAHCRLGHISHTVIKHAITSGRITGINLDMDLKPDFCKLCTKAKSAHQPFPKESDT